jgi:endonuclease YncB( thermonuclease family)
MSWQPGMRRPRAPGRVIFAVTVGMIALFIFAGMWIFALLQTPSVRRPAASVDPASTPASAAIAAAKSDDAAAPRQQGIRDITPSGMTRVHMPAAAIAAEPQKPATSIHIEGAGVRPNGSIAWDGGRVQLYGVTLPDPKRICMTTAGEPWPCGRRAFIALHNKIAAKPLDCATRASTDPPAAVCFVADTNLSVWLLSEGFGRLPPDVGDKELVAAEAGARKAKLGIWLDAREADPPPPAAHP